MSMGSGLLVGKPADGCEVRIVRSHPNASLGPFAGECFLAQCLAEGEIGEIVVHGPHVLSGYANPARNAGNKIEVDGRIWHRTGDAGYFDQNGRLWLVGRCDAVINDDHGVVYPFQVEYAMSGTPGVRRSALRARNGRRVLVLETSGRRFEANCANAARCVARHGIDHIVTIRRIPMDKRHDAKIDYPALYRLLDGRWARIRLNLVESVSTLFRRGRSVYRSLAKGSLRTGCNSPGSASKVGECPLKTHF